VPAAAARGQQTEVITIGLRKTNCLPNKFKIAGLVKKLTILGTFGPKFPVFLLVYGHLRAAGVPNF
jgi:hypothetical protein